MRGCKRRDSFSIEQPPSPCCVCYAQAWGKGCAFSSKEIGSSKSHEIGLGIDLLSRRGWGERKGRAEM
jgi:hypothetical protein